MAGFALRALGMVFRVFVAARLGPEGMGLYQLILSVYMVFVSLASAGINVASTRLGAQCLTRGRGIAPTLRSLAATAAVLGTAAMLAQLALADPLARFALHDSRAELGLCTLAPSLPFIAAAGALRGCFLARRRVEPNIIAQLVEQTVRMAVAALALVKLAHWGAAYACCAVLIGNTVSEAVSCGIMALFARQEPSFRPCADDPPRGYTSRELWEIVLPVTGSRLVASVLQAGESVLIPACLAAYLGTRAEAVAQYGSLKGMALPLIFFPFSVLAALSGLLMPEITRAHTARDTAALRRLVRLAMGLTGGFSLLVGAALVLFGKDAAILLYHDAQAGRYVQVLGFVAPFMYLESMVDAILKGMGEQLADTPGDDAARKPIGLWIDGLEGGGGDLRLGAHLRVDHLAAEHPAGHDALKIIFLPQLQLLDCIGVVEPCDLEAGHIIPGGDALHPPPARQDAPAGLCKHFGLHDALGVGGGLGDGVGL